jgi:hypothetical protein
MCDTVDTDGLENKKSNYKTVECVENWNMEATSTEQGLMGCFFCLYPHSIIINKTVLIESCWADTVNTLLLSIIYGTTIYTLSLLNNEPLKRWSACNMSGRNLFLNYAHTLLQQGANQSPKVTLSQFRRLCSCPLLNSSLVIQKRARYYWAMPT